ncbi:hypothetical protein [Salinicola halimionae]|uniref:hypothetical protein n=1 Tax=Salinicola halimionae TaxID=1949081 RepID=UPI000DA149C6|nr:hypothetical protein [Salinicola halimionae]
MTDQAAGLRVWAECADSLMLGVIGEPGEDLLMRALVQLPSIENRRWQAVRGTPASAVTGWMLWVDTAGVDAADLYRCVKRALMSLAASPASANPLPLLLWLHDACDRRIHPLLDSPTARQLDNLSAALKRFLNVELTRDPADWQRRLRVTGRLSAASG